MTKGIEPAMTFCAVALDGNHRKKVTFQVEFVMDFGKGNFQDFFSSSFSSPFKNLDFWEQDANKKKGIEE